MHTDKHLWVRFAAGGRTGFGTLAGTIEQGQIHEFSGDVYGARVATDTVHALADVKLLHPSQPTKVIALWNNFKALRSKLGLGTPAEPLYFIKSPNSYAHPGDTVLQPWAQGKVVFEGELGIVIGKTATNVSESDAMAHVFGYTCANDITEAEILNRDASFAQWVRAKGMDGFCPMGPAIATGLDPTTLVVRTVLNGDLRQDYPISDMHFSVAQLVSFISRDMTLFPGDVILCGTSVGVGSMKPGSEVSVQIEGIGTLSNRYAAR
jgi:2-keto-4-pentenoate hydratase/2-oxohepta-3-ene-1,7-dioic acid hydratase in catechol pathway